jgi:hypothetical protein
MWPCAKLHPGEDVSDADLFQSNREWARRVSASGAFRNARTCSASPARPYPLGLTLPAFTSPLPFCAPHIVPPTCPLSLSLSLTRSCQVHGYEVVPDAPLLSKLVGMLDTFQNDPGRVDFAELWRGYSNIMVRARGCWSPTPSGSGSGLTRNLRLCLCQGGSREHKTPRRAQPGFGVVCGASLGVSPAAPGLLAALSPCRVTQCGDSTPSSLPLPAPPCPARFGSPRWTAP